MPAQNPNDDPREVAIKILRDELGACEKREPIRGYSTLQDAWEKSAPVWHLIWEIETFLDSAQEIQRIHRMVRTVRRFAADLNRRCHEEGKSPPIPKEEWDALERALYVAVEPQGYFLVTGAKKPTARKASEQIKKKISLERFHNG